MGEDADVPAVQRDITFHNPYDVLSALDKIGSSKPVPCWSSRVTIEPIKVVLVQS